MRGYSKRKFAVYIYIWHIYMYTRLRARQLSATAWPGLLAWTHLWKRAGWQRNNSGRLQLLSFKNYLRRWLNIEILLVIVVVDTRCSSILNTSSSAFNHLFRAGCNTEKTPAVPRLCVALHSCFVFELNFKYIVNNCIILRRATVSIEVWSATCY